MALVLADRVRDTTTTTGTGTVTLSGTAPTGYQTFGSAIGNSNSCYYTIAGGAEWEVGIGTYTTAGTALSRDTVLASSNAGSLVSFSTGTKDVFVTYPAEKAVYQDASGAVIARGNIRITPSGTADAYLYFNNTNTYSTLSFQNSGVDYGYIQAYYAGSANVGDIAYGGRFHYFKSYSGTEYARITSSGQFAVGTIAPSASAIMDVQSTTKGVRFPNMTTTQKNAISGPVAGLVVFDTTLSKLCVYSGAGWETVTSI